MIKKIIFTAFFFLFATPAYANSVSTTIENNVNTSSTNTTSSTKSHTEVNINQNGKEIHYESDTPGSVEVKSVNGESSIKVNGQEVSANTSNSPTNGSATNTPTKAATEEAKTEVEIKNNEDIEEKIMEAFKKPFKIIASIIFFWKN